MKLVCIDGYFLNVSFNDLALTLIITGKLHLDFSVSETKLQVFTPVV